MTQRTYIIGTFAGCTTPESHRRRMIEALVALHRQREDMPVKGRQYIMSYSPGQGPFEIGWDETGLAMNALPVPQSVYDDVCAVFGFSWCSK
jgi:hypothetical protein